MIAILFAAASLSVPSPSPQPQVSGPGRRMSAQEWIGLASWYGGGERLNPRTAAGRRFNPEALEAAMWEVPLDSIVRVTNQGTGRSIVVRITDRGPARRLRRERVIDLTRRAFAQLAPLRQGLVPVVVQRIR
jgi:rare lipoprotein A